MKRPIEALRSPRLFESGSGHLVVSRFKADGRVETGYFLIDMFCLGVRDAEFAEFDDYADLRENLRSILFGDEEPAALIAAAARKLVEDAAAYGRSLGFAPAAGYKKACRVFGGVLSADCDEQFVFGKDGKPFYIQGPGQSPECHARILRVLEASCGDGGYEYLAAADDLEPDDDTDEFARVSADPGDPESGPYSTAALQEMAKRVQAEQPGVRVVVNPSGQRKVSDMISLVAEPLLEEAPDYKAQDMVLKLAALAWNFCRFPADRQREMLEDIKELFSEARGVEMFALLVARTMSLFPEEDRTILKIETEPGVTEVGLRIMSTM